MDRLDDIFKLKIGDNLKWLESYKFITKGRIYKIRAFSSLDSLAGVYILADDKSESYYRISRFCKHEYSNQPPSLKESYENNNAILVPNQSK